MKVVIAELRQLKNYRLWDEALRQLQRSCQKLNIAEWIVIQERLHCFCLEFRDSESGERRQNVKTLFKAALGALNKASGISGSLKESEVL